MRGSNPGPKSDNREVMEPKLDICVTKTTPFSNFRKFWAKIGERIQCWDQNKRLTFLGPKLDNRQVMEPKHFLPR